MQEMSTYLTSLPQFVDLGRQLTTLVLKLDLRTFETRIECRDLGVLGLDRRVVLAGHTFLLLDRVTHRGDTGICDIRGKLKRRLFNTALPLQVVAFSTPVSGYRDSVPVAFEVEKETRVGRGDICPFYDLRLLD